MIRNTQISIPTLVRIKPGAIDRLGIYALRARLPNVVLISNAGLDSSLLERVAASMKRENINIVQHDEVDMSSFERAQDIFQSLPASTSAIFGIGGGKALDVAKYVAFLTKLPYIAVPTALSNDGFCSPQASLEFKGKRRSFPAAMPYGVVVDSQVCLQAPRVLWWSGIGDSVAKITAVYDWKLAFKVRGTPVDDLAALLSDATVFQLMAKPDHDLEGIRLLATALMLNGIAMEICGSSRPASGSEHLISHALDLTSSRPRLHGLQVGVATYIISQLQGQGADRIAGLFDATGFWSAFAGDPLDRREWTAAFRLAPTIKADFYTILSDKDRADDLMNIIDNDPRLLAVFSSK
ncbi:MAG: iron-containing alcohol dehydrogenase family protein [Candidatus Omnitrophica bacterium]|nr:iron-containing alcohol dehydrogenase family protein [Candidatus Omnitrophota bacterium]